MALTYSYQIDTQCTPFLIGYLYGKTIGYLEHHPRKGDRHHEDVGRTVPLHQHAERLITRILVFFFFLGLIRGTVRVNRVRVNPDEVGRLNSVQMRAMHTLHACMVMARHASSCLLCAAKQPNCQPQAPQKLLRYPDVHLCCRTGFHVTDSFEIMFYQAVAVF